MSQKIIVSYEPQELQVLTELINMAVKAGGLPIASNALILHQKHVTAMEHMQEYKQPTEVPAVPNEG